MAETYPYTALALMKFKSPPGSAPLAFQKGDKVDVLGAADDEGDWLNAQFNGAEGVIPSSFVQRVEEEAEALSAPAATPPIEQKEQEEASASSTTPAVSEPTAEVKPLQATPVASSVEQPKPAPMRQPSLPAASSNDTASSPPETPKKPGSLRDRIAALNAAGAGAGGPGPSPIPRPKPAAFKRASIPVPAPAPVAASSPAPDQSSAPISSSSPPEKSTIKGAMSAEDAKESIGKGGSLKDRIAALQGMTLDTPAAPGRAPKPWKKKTAEVEEEGAPANEGEATEVAAPKVTSPTVGDEEEQEGQVKDTIPSEVETTAQSPGAEVPQFSPASPASSSPAPDTLAHPFVAPPLKDEDGEASATTLPTEKVAEATSSVEPSAEPAQEDEEDDETAKRSAIAARMAGLGGQRVGMVMPALPKRAGPPRRRAPAAAAATQSEDPISPIVENSSQDVKSEGIAAPQEALPPAPAPAPSEEIASPQTFDESTAINEPAPVEEEESQPAQDDNDSLEREVAAPVTLGNSSLLASAQAEESDGDDFDTPDLPEADSDDDFDTPQLPEASSPIAQPAQEQERVEEAPLEQAEESMAPASVSLPVVAAPPLPPGRPAVPPPPPPAQPPRDDSDEEAGEDREEPSSKPDLSVETEDLEPPAIESTPVPTSPATASRPAIPSIPASFAPPPSAPVKEPIVIPRSVQVEDEEQDEVLTPSSPATATRPAIPGIPSSFASPTSPPLKVLPIVPTRHVEQEDEEEQYATAGQSHNEAVDSPMDPDLPARAPPSLPKAMPPPHRAATAASTEDEEQEPGVEEREDEAEEEDPEVARRAALAARMAKLGGMNMRMGPMMPPIGGMRKPTKKKSEPVESAAEERAVEEQEETSPPPRRLPGMPTGGFALPGITRPMPAEPEPEPEIEQAEEQETREEESTPVEEEQRAEIVEDEVVPPPLPAGRPLSALPPRRSIPTPEASQDDDDFSSEAPPLPTGRPPIPPQIAGQYVEEPEAQYEEESAHEVEEMAPPPPPSRPQGGLPPIPLATAASPPLPPTASPPGSPPSRRASIFGKSASKRDSVSSLERAPTRSSMDSTRAPGGYLGDDTTPQRTNSTSLPALPESTGPAPPSFAPAQLTHFSSTIGAQVFAGAHVKLTDKAAREQSGESLLGFCLSRATDPLPPRGWSFGASVLELEGSSKGKATVLNEVDEPRAGDVIVFHDTKFKHNLSTSRIGTAERPFVAVVAAWDSKKRKVKTIEVNSSGVVEEGAHRMEDLKSGKVAVWRVLPRDSV